MTVSHPDARDVVERTRPRTTKLIAALLLASVSVGCSSQSSATLIVGDKNNQRLFYRSDDLKPCIGLGVRITVVDAHGKSATLDGAYVNAGTLQIGGEGLAPLDLSGLVKITINVFNNSTNGECPLRKDDCLHATAGLQQAVGSDGKLRAGVYVANFSDFGKC